MSERLLFVATLAAAIGCGAVGGAFLAFSTFVMRALGRLPAPRAVAAMQAINLEAVRPAFLSAFLGTAAVCAVVGVEAVVAWHRPGAALRLAGAALYLAGTLLLTIAYHVPRNDALGAKDPEGPDAANAWRRYTRGWTAWNHVRTAAALAGAAALILGLPFPRDAFPD